jgi:hypothetical protein
MVKESSGYNLLDEVMERSRVPWHWLAATVFMALLLLLILVTYLDGTLRYLLVWRFWQDFAQAPVIIGYILLIYPLFWRLYRRALEAFRPLLVGEEGVFDRVVAGVHGGKRRWEVVAVLVGAGFWLALEQPWRFVDQWLDAYAVVTHVLMFGLLAWLVYTSLLGNVRLNRLSRRHLDLDVFDTGVLAPVAHWGLASSIAFVGGISLSAIFEPFENMLSGVNITVWAILLCVPVLIFFLSMWSAHSAMAKVKRRDLDLARRHLAAASRELKDRVAQGRTEGMEALASALSAWAVFERRVTEAPAWPLDAGSIRRLMVSLPIPGIVYAVKIFLGG